MEEIHQERKVILPIHPRTKKIIKKIKLKPNITFIEPVGYFDMLTLLKNCAMVITDSGGLQKEAFFNKKHCIIVREETEWIELVQNGFAEIVGTDRERIVKVYEKFLDSDIDFNKELYGNNVGEKIYQSIYNLIQA